MKASQTGRFALLRSSLLELPRERPLDVECAAGTLWLTLDDDPRDLVLEPGERVRIDADRRVLAYAMADAVVEVRGVARSVARPVPPLRWGHPAAA